MRVVKSKSSKAGLIFPVSRIDRYLRKCTPRYRIGGATAVYIAAVMEYLAAEVLELAGIVAKDNKRRRIIPRHILLAVANDDEIREVLRTVTIPSAGVIPNIVFLTKSSSKSPVTKHKKPQKPANVKSSKQQKIIFCDGRTKANTKSKTRSKTTKKISSTVKPKPSVPQSVADKPNVKKYNPGDKPKVTVLSEKQLFLGQRLTVVEGSIVDVMADAIVNPTNASFFMGGQVGKTLIQEGGKKFEEEVNNLKSASTLAPAEAAICLGYNFVAEYVIHCNGPTNYSNTSIDLLKKTIKNCLSLADSKNLESLALPSIGSGRAGFPKVEAAKIILETIGNYFSTVMSSSVKQIYFVLYDKESIDAYTNEILKLNL